MASVTGFIVSERPESELALPISVYGTCNPLFLPPWPFRNGHFQTLAGVYANSPRCQSGSSVPVTEVTGIVTLSDGDCLAYHDDCPADWQSGSRVAVLLHGLSGSHASPYIHRIARQLNQRQVRTFRVDWRGCGAGAALARFPYHSGRSDDVRAVLAMIRNRCPESSISVIGFSLGGNVTLKLLGESQPAGNALSAVDRAVAVCPPIDLRVTVESLQRGLARLYDHYFCKACVRGIRQRQQQRPDAVIPAGWLDRPPRTMFEFDDTFTAPVCGFASAVDYYSKSSSIQFLASIKVPTLIIAAQDDPVIPFRQFRVANFGSAARLLDPRHGGHLGFWTPRGSAWLDEQILDWASPRP